MDPVAVLNSRNHLPDYSQLTRGALPALVTGIGCIAIGLLGYYHAIGERTALAGIGIAVATSVTLYAAWPAPGAFRSKRPLGKGIDGEVYSAQWHGCKVAIKQPLANKDGAGLRRAMLIGSMGLDVVATHYDLQERETHLDCVMEFVDGQTVQSYLDCAHLSRPEKARLLIDILTAYRSLLEKRVLPVDAHLNNIMRTSDGKIKFIDLDLYAFLGEETPDYSNATKFFSELLKLNAFVADALDYFREKSGELTEEDFLSLIAIVDHMIERAEERQ